MTFILYMKLVKITPRKNGLLTPDVEWKRGKTTGIRARNGKNTRRGRNQDESDLMQYVRVGGVILAE